MLAYELHSSKSATQYRCGQDIFLLETGFAAVLAAPLWGWRASSPLPPVAWLLRFQLFKIMFMSGIVKTQANCPTWKSLWVASSSLAFSNV